MVDQNKIKGLGTLNLEFDGIKITPDPKCKKCFGRGYAVFNHASEPIPCQCLRKQWSQLKAQRTREGSAQARENVQALALAKAIDDRFDKSMDFTAGQTMGMNLEDIRDKYPAQWKAAMLKFQVMNPARYQEIMKRMDENDKHKAEQLQKGIAERSINNEQRTEGESNQGLPGEGMPATTEVKGG